MINKEQRLKGSRLEEHVVAFSFDGNVFETKGMGVFNLTFHSLLTLFFAFFSVSLLIYAANEASIVSLFLSLVPAIGVFFMIKNLLYFSNLPRFEYRNNVLYRNKKVIVPEAEPINFERKVWAFSDKRGVHVRYGLFIILSTGERVLLFKTSDYRDIDKIIGTVQKGKGHVQILNESTYKKEESHVKEEQKKHTVVFIVIIVLFFTYQSMDFNSVEFKSNKFDLDQLPENYIKMSHLDKNHKVDIQDTISIEDSLFSDYYIDSIMEDGSVRELLNKVVVRSPISSQDLSLFSESNLISTNEQTKFSINLPYYDTDGNYGSLMLSGCKKVYPSYQCVNKNLIANYDIKKEGDDSVVYISIDAKNVLRDGDKILDTFYVLKDKQILMYNFMNGSFMLDHSLFE